MSLSLPEPPVTGIVTDSAGIEWRRDSAGCWNPGGCPTCGTVLATGLSWPELLERRGPLTPVTGGPS
ncbi:hypothetical protein OOK41_31590 [Micromonospora sp. NBC_01655]|uniref:hypothetical protein n=1 Tax=Micromonospora sp. NBC_01655 TaxID=2975983 RepID=UPI00225A1061|nr:hypothetical protein [Micromonospora sp. NBC_01655]MCX4474805.1 hypothetical protein [Micromonospora sp. NBC_01655]